MSGGSQWYRLPYKSLRVVGKKEKCGPKKEPSSIRIWPDDQIQEGQPVSSNMVCFSLYVLVNILWRRPFANHSPISLYSLATSSAVGVRWVVGGGGSPVWPRGGAWPRRWRWSERWRRAWAAGWAPWGSPAWTPCNPFSLQWGEDNSL